MVIIETAIFTKLIRSILSDEQYRLLQNQLMANPLRGNLIPGSGGLRKMRWSVSGRGKRGGLRIIYYWLATTDVILLLFVYPKTGQQDLTREQLKALKKVIDEEYP